MNVRSTLAGILYNVFVPSLGRPKEALSERALKTAAQQAGAALLSVGYRIQWIPVRDRIEEIVAPIRRRRPAVIVNLCEGFRGHSAYEAQVQTVLSAGDVQRLQHVVRGVPVGDHVLAYGVRLARATRPGEAGSPDFVNNWVTWGAGPRAGPT